MIANPIVEHATADGLTFGLSPSGAVRVSGEEAVIDRWAEAIRANKAAIAESLRSSPTGTGRAAPNAPEGDTHQQWSLVLPDRAPFIVIIPQGATVQWMQGVYPTAVCIRPVRREPRAATPGEVQELTDLISIVLADRPEDWSTALRIAARDVDAALTSFRALALNQPTRRARGPRSG